MKKQSEKLENNFLYQRNCIFLDIARIILSEYQKYLTDNKSVDFSDMINDAAAKVDDFMKEWKIESKDKRINLTFTPILDRKDDTNVIILRSNQHQVFGKFNGYILNGEDKVEFIDMVGFAEKVFNKW